MTTLEDVLENVKSSGAYQVMCYYGGEVGCDDMDTPAKDRGVRIIWHPAGFLGEIRAMWYGKLGAAYDIDFKTLKPTKISNPPKKGETDGEGFWAWGTDRMIEDYLKRFNPA